VNKYAASLISDRHTGSYDECIRSATLDPIWKIVVQRRLSLFRAYVEERRFIPEGFLSVRQSVRHSGLRSSDIKANENRQQFEKPIKSHRQQCETTALYEMITYWNILPNSVIDLTTTGFKTRIKSGDYDRFSEQKNEKKGAETKKSECAAMISISELTKYQNVFLTLLPL
jgi:hypothetical protein